MRGEEHARAQEKLLQKQIKDQLAAIQKLQREMEAEQAAAAVEAAAAAAEEEAVEVPAAAEPKEEAAKATEEAKPKVEPKEEAKAEEEEAAKAEAAAAEAVTKAKSLSLAAARGILLLSDDRAQTGTSTAPVAVPPTIFADDTQAAAGVNAAAERKPNLGSLEAKLEGDASAESPRPARMDLQNLMGR